MHQISCDDRTIEEKLKLMTNYDVDQQYMAASDLSEIIEKHYQKISSDKITKIINALLQHLKNQSIQLHGNAIKCLSKIISKLSFDQSKRICNTMIFNIIASSTHAEVRDIYGTCVKTIINDVGLNFGQHINDLLKLAVQALINKHEERSLTVQQQLVDIITSFVKKWPIEVQQTALPRKKFIQYLSTNIIIGKQPILRKRSYVCLGIFSSTLKLDQFQLILLDKQLGLLPHISLNKDYQRGKVLLHSLLSILKSGNQHLRLLSNKIYQEVVKSLKYLKQIDDLSKCQKVYDLLQNNIQCLICLLKISPDLIETNRNQLLSINEELIEYSPYGQIQKITEMEVEQDEFEDESSQDSSWKIRKNIILLIIEISSYSQQMFKTYMGLHQLFERFQESQPQVIETIINGFNTLFSYYTKFSINEQHKVQINSLSKKQSTVYIIEQLLTKLSKHLDRIINNTTLHQNIIVATSKLISCIGRLFTKEITNTNELTNIYLIIAFQGLKKTRYNDVKIDLLNFYQFVLRNVKTELNYEDLFRLFLKSSNNHIYKVSSSAFKAIHALLSTGQMTWLNQFGDAILQRLKETDIDSQVKSSIVGCVSELLQKYPNQIPSHYVQNYLAQLLKKLTAQIQKRHILSSIWKINIAINVTPKLVQILNNILLTLANTVLNISDNVIRIKTCEAIQTILIILSKNVNKDVVKRILEQSKQIFADNVFPQFLKEIINIYPETVIPYLSEIIFLQNFPSDSIKQLIDSETLQINKLLLLIENNLDQQNIKNAIKIISKLDVDIRSINNTNKNPLKEQLIIGYLGSKKNIQNFEFFMNLILNQTKDDRVRLQASSALGLTASINISQYLPIIINGIYQRKDNYYLVNSLKYLIKNSSEKDEQALLDLEQSLFKIQSSNESTSICIAQCIGQIVHKNPSKSFLIISEKLKSSDHHIRFLASSSYRYFMNIAQKGDQILQNYVQNLILLINDSNISVRSSVIKSLNIIAYYSHNILNPFLNDHFFSSLNKLLLFDESLVEIVNYGSSKEKVDKGKPIRIDGFTFLQTLLDKISLSQHQISLVINICLGTIETDSSIDVVINRIQLLKRIIQSNIKLLKESELQIVTKLGVENGKLKQYKQKTQITDSKTEKIYRNSSKQEIDAEIQSIKTVPFFAQKIKNLKH